MSSGRFVIGLGLLSVGALLLLERLDVLNAGDAIADWWPLILIVLGVVQLIESPHHYLIPATLIVVGGLLLVGSLEVANVTIDELIGPAVLVVIGVYLLLGLRFRHSTAYDDTVSSFVAFSGRDASSSSQAFRGGSIFTAFGGTEVDLRSARPVDGGAQLDVVTAFGGTDIIVPEGWRVVVKGLPLFGGWSNKTAHDVLPADAPELDVNALVAFGGLEVKHTAA